MWDFGFSEELTIVEAQKKTVEYHQLSVNGLTPGTRLETIGKVARGLNIKCGDWERGQRELLAFSVGRWILSPPGVFNAQVEAALKKVWSDAGWKLMVDVPSLVTPNVVAVTDDGYRMLLTYRGPKGDEPVLDVTSPCYPAENGKQEVSIPVSLSAGG